MVLMAILGNIAILWRKKKMARFKYDSFNVGDLVSGISGKRQVIGYVLPDPRNPGRPYVRMVRSGAVLCVVQEKETGRKRWVNEIIKV